tara:strand:+ start:2121 stop:3218 length:1098 start_codon:yes stop_codon:yes gene_type:complete
MNKKDRPTAIETFNLAVQHHKKKNFELAKQFYLKTLNLDPKFVNAHYNLGNLLHVLGEYRKAINSFKKAIEIEPKFTDAYNNLGIVYDLLGKSTKAKLFYKKTIEIEANYTNGYWNLHSLSSNIDEALDVLKKSLTYNKNFLEAKIMIGILESFKGNFDYFNSLRPLFSNHPMFRSASWVFSLRKLPKIFFNRWNLFDETVVLAEKNRPFYEFGVWKGISFKYFLNIFKKGFGFDTFTGLPEDWYDNKSGTYSAFKKIPKFKRGSFFAGKFEDTLPKFFSKKRPLASIINFDADLYSSTLCALNYSKDVIDNKTILFFDEFLTSKNWENDEYKALKEFCDKFNYQFEVIAISFYSKQAVVKLIDK